jgi:hypothetical protein
VGSRRAAEAKRYIASPSKGIMDFEKYSRRNLNLAELTRLLLESLP